MAAYATACTQPSPHEPDINPSGRSDEVDDDVAPAAEIPFVSTTVLPEMRRDHQSDFAVRGLLGGRPGCQPPFSEGVDAESSGAEHCDV
jgi:hypothetical protein